MIKKTNLHWCQEIYLSGSFSMMHKGRPYLYKIIGWGKRINVTLCRPIDNCDCTVVSNIIKDFFTAKLF